MVRAAHGATSIGVLSDKLTPPLIPWFAVDRPELLARLRAARGSKVVLVSAPAGYGKSVLAAQYAQAQRDLPVGWLQLDAGDNDAARLATHLVAALGTGLDEFGEAPLERLTVGTEGFGREFCDLLSVELRYRGPILVVVDGLEAITQRAIRADLLSLLRSAPRHVHVVLITRSNPQVPMHRLRLLDELVEIGEDELALDPAAARELVERVAARTLTDAQAGALHERTEGWPAGLQVAGLALRDVVDAHEVDACIASFGGAHAALDRLLSDEVLAGLDPAVVGFLLTTSVVDRVNGALADALTGRDDGAALLAALHDGAFFVARAGDGSDWYRYHGLLRSVLRHRLHRTDPDAERRALLAAAAWFLERKEVDAAVPLLVAAEDWPQVIALVRAHGGPYFQAGRAATALAWLSAVPHERRADDPLVALEHAALSSMAGDSLVAETDLNGVSESVALTPGEAMAAAAIRATWIDHHAPPDVVIEWCDAALADLPGITDIPDLFGITAPHSIQTILEVSRARGVLYGGEAEAGRQALETVEARLLREARLGPWLVNVESSVAMVDAWTGRLAASEERYHRAIRHVTALAPAFHASAAHAHLAMGQVLLERDETARAELLLADTGAAANQAMRPLPIVLHAILRCRLALAINEPDQGLDEFDRLRARGFAPFPPAVAARALAIHLQLLLAAGQGQKALRLLDSRGRDLRGPMVGAAAAVLVHGGHLDRARRVLDAPADAGDDRTEMERALWTAVVVEDDDPGRAAALVDDVLARAEMDGHARLFLDGGSPVLRLLRRHFERHPSPYLRGLVAAEAAPSSPSAAANRTLIDPLSERELVVLGFLATRLSNAEIAERLFVSVNTLKTHLRHVYAKLGVNDRRGALGQAEALGLI
jgi:LuxR family maltose regulon positive regulatory protein